MDDKQATRLDSSNHFNAAGQPRMVDVSDKSITQRTAVAESWVSVSAPAMEMIRGGESKKGDVLAVARLAAIMATKQTATLIPLCHAIPIEAVEVEFETEHEGRVRCLVKVCTTARTGVEMEAMTAVSVAALTIYDMCKAVDRSLQLGPVRLLEKTGGSSGDYGGATAESASAKR